LIEPLPVSAAHSPRTEQTSQRSLRKEAPESAGLSADLDAGRSGMTWARVGIVFLTVALVLILAGTAVGERQMVLGGLSVLGVLPLMIALVLAHENGRQ